MRGNPLALARGKVRRRQVKTLTAAVLPRKHGDGERLLAHGVRECEELVHIFGGEETVVCTRAESPRDDGDVEAPPVCRMAVDGREQILDVVGVEATVVEHAHDDRGGTRLQRARSGKDVVVVLLVVGMGKLSPHTRALGKKALHTAYCAPFMLFTIFVFAAASPCMDQFRITTGPLDDKSPYDCLEDEDFLSSNYTWQSNGGSYTIDFETEHVTCDGTSYSKRRKDFVAYDSFKCVNGKDEKVNTTWLGCGCISLWGRSQSDVHLFDDHAVVRDNDATRTVLWNDGSNEFYTGEPMHERLVLHELPDGFRHFYSGPKDHEEVTKIVLPDEAGHFHIKDGKLVDGKLMDVEFSEGVVKIAQILVHLGFPCVFVLLWVLSYFCCVFAHPSVSGDDGRALSKRFRFRQKLLMLQRSEGGAKRQAAERLRRDREEALLNAQKAKEEREAQIRRYKQRQSQQAQEEADEEHRRREMLREEREKRAYQHPNNVQPRVPVHTPSRRDKKDPKQPVLTPEEARVRKMESLRAQRRHEDSLRRRTRDMIDHEAWQQEKLRLAYFIGHGE